MSKDVGPGAARAATVLQVSDREAVRDRSRSFELRNAYPSVLTLPVGGT